MCKISSIIKLIEDICPVEKAIPTFDDNVGLILGSKDRVTDTVLCALDVTYDVVEEAKERGAGLIISHHPVVFLPQKKITDESILGKKILAAAEEGIAIYAAHTNLDTVIGGINDFVARLIGLSELRVMESIGGEEGIGRVGKLSTPQGLLDLTKMMAEVFDDPFVRLIAREDCSINRAAIINGDGGSVDYIELAKSMDAECLITADVKYHAALYAYELGFPIIEITHYAMEKIYINELRRLLTLRALDNGMAVNFIESQRERAPYLNIK